jgi:PleD family two-component response regulator
LRSRAKNADVLQRSRQSSDFTPPDVRCRSENPAAFDRERVEESNVPGQVLVVGDQPLKRDLLRTLLHATDCTAEEAGDGEEAPRLATAHRLALEFSGIPMPR